MRSYQRCMNVGPDGKRSATDARLFAASYPFDADALSLLTGEEIARAPTERVNGAVHIRCEWFGWRAGNERR